MSRIGDWRDAVDYRGMMPRRGIHRNTFYYRDKTLYREGFIQAERDTFATGRIGTQAMRAMRAERRGEFADFKEAFETRMAKSKVTKAERAEAWEAEGLVWADKITAMYRDRDWTYRDGDICPWFYLEDVRERKNLDETPTGRSGSLLDGNDILDMFTVKSK